MSRGMDRDKDNIMRLPKLLGIIRKTIKNWLDSTPSFAATYFSTYLIVREAAGGSQLAVIEFKDDHLIVNVPLPQEYNCLARLSLLTGMASDGHKILYSDPKLHTRVKFVVNRAYQQQDR